MAKKFDLGMELRLDGFDIESTNGTTTRYTGSFTRTLPTLQVEITTTIKAEVDPEANTCKAFYYSKAYTAPYKVDTMKANWSGYAKIRKELNRLGYPIQAKTDKATPYSI